MNNRHALPQVLAGLALVVASLACNAGLPNVVEGPKAPCSVSTSKEAAARLSARISEASQQSGEPVTITASSEEISSLIAQSLEEAKNNAPDSSLNLEQPIVCFTGGQMQLYGSIKPDGNISINALIAISASIADGKIAVTVERIQLGPIPVPEALRDQVSQQISTALNDNLDKIELTDIQIEEGQMTLTGRVR